MKKGRKAMAVKVETSEQIHRSQDKFLNDIKVKNEKIKIDFTNGKTMIGKIVSFDQFTIQLLGKDGVSLLFKSGITAISPAPVREFKSKVTKNTFTQNIEIPAKIRSKFYEKEK